MGSTQTSISFLAISLTYLALFFSLNEKKVKFFNEEINLLDSFNAFNDFKSALMCIDSNIKLAIKYISELRESSDMRTDVQSKVDDELGYLNKESRYFIRRRLKEPMSSDNDVEMEAYAYNDLL